MEVTDNFAKEVRGKKKKMWGTIPKATKRAAFLPKTSQIGEGKRGACTLEKKHHVRRRKKKKVKNRKRGKRKGKKRVFSKIRKSQPSKDQYPWAVRSEAKLGGTSLQEEKNTLECDRPFLFGNGTHANGENHVVRKEERGHGNRGGHVLAERSSSCDAVVSNAKRSVERMEQHQEKEGASWAC